MYIIYCIYTYMFTAYHIRFAKIYLINGNVMRSSRILSDQNNNWDVPTANDPLFMLNFLVGIKGQSKTMYLYIYRLLQFCYTPTQ